MTSARSTTESKSDKPKATKHAMQPHAKRGHKAEPPTALVEVVNFALEAKPFDADARRRLIAEAAYYRAAQRGFEPGGEADDWLSAEAEVDAQLCGGTRD